MNHKNTKYDQYEKNTNSYHSYTMMEKNIIQLVQLTLTPVLIAYTTAFLLFITISFFQNIM